MNSTQHRPRIVADLVPVILEVHNYWPRDLQRLALVSSQWLGSVRRLLYAHPRMNSFRSCNLLEQSLKNNPHLIPLVQSIDLRPWYVHGRALTAADAASIKFLLNLPSLTCVTLGGQVAVAVESFLLKMSNAHALTELNIDGHIPSWDYHCSLQMNPSPTLHWDERLAVKFPSLRKLRLSNLELHIAEPTSTPSLLRLTDLALNGVTITHGSLHHISWDTLGHLSIAADSADDWDEHIRFMLHRSTDNLKAFSYEVSDSRMDSGIFQDELSPLLSLRELHLRGVSVDSLTLDSLQRQCPNLEHLSIYGRIATIPCQEWISFLRSGALPYLRHLNIPYGSLMAYSPEDGTIKELTEVCRGRGIQILPPVAHGV
jgi:hypothetical protein